MNLGTFIGFSAVLALIVDAGIIAAGAVWLYRRRQAATDPVLTPIDDGDIDAISANFAIITTIRYESTGNTDRMVILDEDDTPSWKVKRAIQTIIPGANVTNIERVKLYRKGPAWDRVLDDIHDAP